MNNTSRTRLAALLAGASLLFCSPFALADHVNLSLNVGVPLAQPVFIQPAPVYFQPQPVYVQSYAQPVAVVRYGSYRPQPYYEQEFRHGHEHGHGHGHGRGHGEHHGHHHGHH